MEHSFWIQADEFGTLNLEKVLITFDVPELFVCKNERGERYIALYLDEDTNVYLLAKINSHSLVQMLTGKIPMDQVFRNTPDGNAYYISCCDGKKFSIKKVRSSEVPDCDLPEADALFTLQNEKINNYINLLKDQSCPVRDGVYAAMYNATPTYFSGAGIAVKEKFVFAEVMNYEGRNTADFFDHMPWYFSSKELDAYSKSAFICTVEYKNRRINNDAKSFSVQTPPLDQIKLSA